MIPDHLLQDRYWRGLIYIFTKHAKLSHFLTPEFVDFEELSVHVDKLKKVSKGWSTSEKFMLAVALHLFNGRNKFDMSEADRLDDRNTEILIHALRLRYAM
ncbi:hypothetical protein H70357_10520 [Paenibacillus sp. FSL H7-0357]|uniref:hypothetical protein n=1 Tax=Paenibacillus sp. FSL H7-0357 TaxID=1536774 RepID=UPI0004F8DAD4|nr:hypothetical protein [Paenibacillus sp. FSL H7-0357]AIQ17045.1 hypothetical protein H70357_10520 [Paenibacillus sp. FSL H7-0357]